MGSGRFGLILCSLALAFAAPAGDLPPRTLRSLLLDLNSGPLSVTEREQVAARGRIVGDSGGFSLLPSKPHGSHSGVHWIRRDTSSPPLSAFDLVLAHHPEGSWIRAHIGKRSPAGMPGVLATVSPYVRSFVIDYDPEEVVSEVSLETYRGSVAYCGRIRDTHHRSSCSLVHVVLHGEATIRFYVLIVANSPRQRDELLAEFASVLESIQLHAP